MQKIGQEASLKFHQPDELSPVERQKLMGKIELILDNALDNNYGARLGRALGLSLLRDPKQKAQELEAAQRTRQAANQAGEEVGLYIHASGERKTIGFSSATGEITMPCEGLIVEDPDKLCKILNSLKPEDLTSAEKNIARFNELLLAINAQLIAEYKALHDAGAEPKNFFQLIYKMKALIARLGELISLDAITKTNHILENAETMTLGEYLTLQNAQCFDTPEMHTFGPSQWHHDSTAEDYARRWDRVLKTVEQVEKNPQASVLVQEALMNLQNCVAWALADIGKTPDAQTAHYNLATYQSLLEKVGEWINYKLEKLAAQTSEA